MYLYTYSPPHDCSSLLISARIPSRGSFSPRRILITIAIIPPRKFCLNASGLTIRRHVASLIILPAATNGEERERGREREIVNPSNPTARFVPAIFLFFFKKKKKKNLITGHGNLGRRTSSSKEEEEGDMTEEGSSMYVRKDRITAGLCSLLFRVCRRLLAKPEKSRRLLAPPLRSMEIKCRWFLLVYERRGSLLLCLGFFG